MLNCSASLAMSTSFLEALPGKLDIKRHSPSILSRVFSIYLTELQLNKTNYSDTEAPFLDLDFSITNDIISSKIYDKLVDFNFEIVYILFPDRDVPLYPSYSVCISQLIH